MGRRRPILAQPRLVALACGEFLIANVRKIRSERNSLIPRSKNISNRGKREGLRRENH
jgi:hypothetical protein